MGIYFRDILLEEILGVPIIVSNMYLRKYLFHNDIYPHIELLLSNERLDFCDFLK